MQKNREIRSLLSPEEYQRLVEKLSEQKSDIQTNHYFDTPRFSLKAQDIHLKVKEREGTLELSFKHRKAYQVNEITLPITKEELDAIIEDGVIPYPEIASELANVVKDQRLQNYLSLCTKRIYVTYASGVLMIDENCFNFPTIIENGTPVFTTDYEIEYVVKNYEEGIKEFVNLIKDFNLNYQKKDRKLKRAYDIYKRIH